MNLAIAIITGQLKIGDRLREDEQRERSRQDILEGLAARLGAGQD